MKTQIIIALLLVAGTTMAQQVGRGRGQDGGRRAPSGEGLIERLDQDSDGKISESEFDGPSEHFSQLDTNGDGYLSTDEMPSAPPRRQQEQGGEGSGTDFVSRLDQNGDGKVSDSEFDGPAEAFSQLDADGDGYLSESEAPAGPPQRGGSRGGRQ